MEGVTTQFPAEHRTAGRARSVGSACDPGAGFAVEPHRDPPAARPTLPVAAFDLTYAQEGCFVVAANGQIGRLVNDEVATYEPRVAKDSVFSGICSLVPGRAVCSRSWKGTAPAASSYLRSR